MKFVADTMLGKLARWLRILGYDTVYDPKLSLQELVSISNRTNALFLTHRKSLPDGIVLEQSFNLIHEQFSEQLKCVINHFGLDTQQYLFTRCLACNVAVQPIEKQKIEGKIPEKAFHSFQEFFQCPTCHSIYWGGTHRTNTLKKLQQILGSTLLNKS